MIGLLKLNKDFNLKEHGLSGVILTVFMIRIGLIPEKRYYETTVITLDLTPPKLHRFGLAKLSKIAKIIKNFKICRFLDKLT